MSSYNSEVEQYPVLPQAVRITILLIQAELWIHCYPRVWMNVCSRAVIDALEDENRAFSGNPQVMAVGIQPSKPINRIIPIFYSYHK